MSMIDLRTPPDKTVALDGIRVESHIAALGQKTTVAQTFVNREDHTIEAVYTFPLPSNAAVCHFEVITADRVLTGQVEESSRAEDLYDEAVIDGHGAMLLERERPDIFTINVGNIKAHASVTIRITYVAEVEVSDNEIRLALPTTVAPRYVSTIGTDDRAAVVDGERINPPRAQRVPYGLTLAADIDLDIPLAEVGSPSHDIAVQHCGRGQARIELADGDVDRDIVLRIKLEREPHPRACVRSVSQDEHYVALSFVPEFSMPESPADGPREYMFVIDCSGSMRGRSIDQARTAVGLCLRGLGAQDHFNICCYGSSFQFWSATAQAYSEHTLTKALRFLDRMNANLGGTELVPPLEEILNCRPLAGGRDIVLLTDGHINNEGAAIDLAREHRAHNRIFALGVGAAASGTLVRGLSAATGAAAEFIADDERIEDKVLRLFGRLHSPMIRGIDVDWGEAEVQWGEDGVPAIFEGDAVALYARLRGRLPRSLGVRIDSSEGPYSCRVELPEPQHDSDIITRLWARQRLENFERERSSADGKRNRDRLKKQMISLSREHGLLCSLTSFVCIEHRTLAERDDGRPSLRIVPAKVPRGWGGHQLDDELVEVGSPVCYDRSFTQANSGLVCGSLRARRHQPAPASDVFTILRQQQADGLFKKGVAINAAMKKHDISRDGSLVTLKAWLHGAVRKSRVKRERDLIDTLLVLFLLEHAFDSQRAVWWRAATKARNAIAEVLVVDNLDFEALWTQLRSAAIKGTSGPRPATGDRRAATGA